jgi:hypothetical protein
MVQFRRSLASGAYFITPHPGYSTQRSAAPPQNDPNDTIHPLSPPYGLGSEEMTVPDIISWGIWYIGTETECEQKLDRDLALLVCSGFNAVRIVGIGPLMESSGLNYNITPRADASLNEYLDLLSKLLSKVASHGLKAILLLGSNSPNTAQWEQPDLYREFLVDVCTEVGEHPGLLAYDLYNEPAWNYPWFPSTNKMVTSHWVADSYWTIKSVSPNALVTIGLTHPSDSGSWDPNLIPVDFISYHFYPGKPLYGDPPVAHAINQMASMYYWAKQTSMRPWIIGETALAGTDNPDPSVTKGWWLNEADQKTFADGTLKKSLDCGCDGYSWWQYQEVRWNDGSDYMGLVTRLDPNPAISEQKKPTFFSFGSYGGLSREPQNAVKPAIYDNLDKHPVEILRGNVFDGDGKPLADASILAKRPVSTGSPDSNCYSTLSALDGSFSLKAPPSTLPIIWAEANKPGYGVVDPQIDLNNVVLEAWRDDTWSRRWIASAPGKLNVTTASSDWVIDPTDAFYVGDFDGDGAHELLCAQTLGSTGDFMAMLRFNGFWTIEWTNERDPSKGGGIYPYRQRMVVGDFDGDGADEVLGIGPQGDWLTLFKYQNGDWQWISSTGGNAQHALRPYANNLHAGNFNGSGGELLLGIDAWTTFFRFDTGKNDWEWVDSDYGKTNDPAHPLSAFRPYASQFMIGDFDGDGRDEILGIAGTGAGSWVTLFGIRGAGSLQWLTSNSASDAVVLSGIVPYRSKAVVGCFDGLTRDRVVGFAGHSALFGFDRENLEAGGDFQRIWGSDQMKLAGLSITAADKIIPFRPLRTMPSYLLVVPDSTTKASLIAFDPILRQ